MLRDIKSPFLKPRLIPLRYTTASNAVTITQGVGCASITSAATGSGVIRLTRAFSRNPLLVSNASSADVAAGGFVSGTANTYPTATGHTALTVNSAATADDGTAHCLFLGYGMRDGTRYSRRSNTVRGDVDQTKVIALQVNTAVSGSVIINSRAVTAVSRTGTGDITLTLRSAFANSGFIAVGTAVLATGQIVMTDVTSANTVRVKVFTNGGSTPADGIVNLLLVGDGQGKAERTSAASALSDQRKPVIIGYSVIYSGGVPTYDFNSGDATLTDTATGRTTFTFLEKFKRETIVVATPIANTGVQCCTIDNSSSTGFEVKQFSAANSLADCTNGGGFQVIGIGFDDPSEY